MLSLLRYNLNAFPEGVKAKVYMKTSPYQGDDGFTYLNVDQAKMDFSVKEIKMGVENISNSNAILRKFYNLISTKNFSP